MCASLASHILTVSSRLGSTQQKSRNLCALLACNAFPPSTCLLVDCSSHGRPPKWSAKPPAIFWHASGVPTYLFRFRIRRRGWTSWIPREKCISFWGWNLTTSCTNWGVALFGHVEFKILVDQCPPPPANPTVGAKRKRRQGQRGGDKVQGRKSGNENGAKTTAGAANALRDELGSTGAGIVTPSVVSRRWS